MQRDVPLVDRARNRWRSILPQIGVDPRFLDGKHHACPVCRDGDDRFRFDNKEGRGTWICSYCGAGDGIEFKEAAERIETHLGDAPLEACRPVQTDQAMRDAMNRVWASSGPVQAGDPVALWLQRRVGLSTFPSCIRAAARILFDADPPTFHPAMITRWTAPDGKPAILHRTYLTAEGAKAQVEVPRRLMRGTIPDGSAARLMPHGEVLGIAEGIETAFAAAALFGVPVWAATNAVILAKWVPPADVRHVIVFGDNDPKFGGAAAAYALAHRLSIRDRRVDVEIPKETGTDWNDVLVRTHELKHQNSINEAAA